jgi:hypothetical protein
MRPAPAGGSEPPPLGHPLVVGVTGHRVLAELGRIEAGIDRALAGIRGAFGGRPLRIRSALAEGADRLVADRALRIAGTTLEAVLPLPPEDFMNDFASAASREEFRRLLARAGSARTRVVGLPAGASREDAYDAGGRAMLDAEVLLAVWDGQGAQGQAGTGSIVALARARKMPLAWVHAGNRRPGTMEPTSLGAEQGAVTFENLPGGSA